MAGVSFALADFVTGGPIVDLPVLEGASWLAQQGRPDSVECTVDMRDADALALDMASSSEPKKTVLFARNDDDIVLAWGLITERTWDEDARTLALSAVGILSSYFGHTIVAPSSARTNALTVVDPGNPLLRIVNPALSTTIDGYSLGTIGKKLVAARLAWPGAPSAPFILPDDEVADRTQTYDFAGFKSVESALNDLSNREGGPDFAFDASRGPDGLSLVYILRHGTEAQPRLGTRVGAWSLGDGSPITGLKIVDNGDDMGSTAWLSAGKSSGTVLLSRTLNDDLINDGYPPLDIVDTSHNDVARQTTLDGYGNEAVAYGRTVERSLSFSVQGDATPALGAYRPGDIVSIDVPTAYPPGPWIEQGVNTSPRPRPTVFAGSGWGAPANFQGIPTPGWVGGVLLATTTPYIFTSPSSRAYAAGEVVTLSVRYRVTAVAGSAQYISVIPHVRTGNAYYRGMHVNRPIVVGQDEVVKIQWTTTVAIAAGNLDLAIVGSNAAGTGLVTADAGFGLMATEMLSAPGVADEGFFDGNTQPGGELERTRWVGEAGNSESILETRTRGKEGHPYLSSSFDIRITSIEGDDTGESVKIGCVVLDG